MKQLKSLFSLTSAALVLILLFALYLWYEDTQKTARFDAAVSCLSRNIWYEATLAKEPPESERAVALVTLLRTVSGRYPRGICRTVFQKAQFSWTLKKALRDAPEPMQYPEYRRVKDLARTLAPLIEDRQKLFAEAAKLKLTPDTYFYKRKDGIGVGAGGQRFFDQCTLEVRDQAAPDVHIVIGAHGYHQPKVWPCKVTPLPKKK